MKVFRLTSEFIYPIKLILFLNGIALTFASDHPIQRIVTTLSLPCIAFLIGYYHDNIAENIRDSVLPGKQCVGFLIVPILLIVIAHLLPELTIGKLNPYPVWGMMAIYLVFLVTHISDSILSGRLSTSKWIVPVFLLFFVTLGAMGMLLGKKKLFIPLRLDSVLYLFLFWVVGYFISLFYDLLKNRTRISLDLLFFSFCLVYFTIRTKEGVFFDIYTRFYPGRTGGALLGLSAIIIYCITVKYLLRLQPFKGLIKCIVPSPVIYSYLLAYDFFFKKMWALRYPSASALLHVLILFSLTVIIQFAILCVNDKSLFSSRIQLSKRQNTAIDMLFYTLFAYCCLDAFVRTTMLTDLFADRTPYRQAYYFCVSMMIVVYTLSLARFQSRRNFLFSLVILGCGYYYYYQGGNNYDVYVMCVLIAAAVGKAFDIILEINLTIGITGIVICFLLSQAGIIENLIYFNHDDLTIGRHALGSGYPTDLAAHILFYTLSYLCLKIKDEKWYHYIDYPILLYICMLTYHLTDARANYILTFSAITMTFVYQIFHLETEAVRAGDKHVMTRLINIIAFLLYPLLALLSNVLTFTYSAETESLIDHLLIVKILSLNFSSYYSRLKIGLRMLQQHGLHLWGSNYSEIGSGRSMVRPLEYNFIDISYVKVVIRFGIVIAILMLALFEAQVYLCSKKHRYDLLLLLIVITVSFAIEHHMMEYGFNIFPLMLFSLTPSHRYQSAHTSPDLDYYP